MSTSLEIDRQRAHEAVAEQRSKAALPVLAAAAVLLAIATITVIAMLASNRRA